MTLQIKPIEEIDLDIINLRNWFAHDQAKVLGGIDSLEMQHIIETTAADWLRHMIEQLEVHFKGLEIQCYKLKDLIEKDKR